jgi:hypothetical protein
MIDCQALAAELVQVRGDVIVTTTTPAAVALKQASATIPIVAAAITHTLSPRSRDRTRQQLDRPGGNLHGDIIFRVRAKPQSASVSSTSSVTLNAESPERVETYGHREGGARGHRVRSAARFLRKALSRAATVSFFRRSAVARSHLTAKVNGHFS